ncbi:hypothetical protein [Actinokineospora sp. NBRC 105648]|uniref:hypothetical protein n=1 Tax=Actinokineospora sp. NBRC 105648 TaxID=3032206 RepID=UPI0024A04CBB|nr:hypothetical protein [Actinokineospora sp. NBRC 105648]GLZ42411.1 hypothetical protein Acsp05_60350 [Actinokineospora sp. NBRC 105648]
MRVHLTIAAVLVCAAVTPAPGPPVVKASFSNTGALALAIPTSTTRAEIINRARGWLAPSVPYSQDAFHTTPHGRYRTDCSGYVSMAWELPTAPYGGTSTQGLASLADPVAKEDLRTGDALIDAVGTNDTRHVALFDQWADAARTEYWGYEQASGTGTVYRKIRYPYDSTPQDYRPYRRPNLARESGEPQWPS